MQYRLRHWLSLGMSALVLLPLVVVAGLLIVMLPPRLEAQADVEIRALSESVSAQAQNSLLDSAKEIRLFVEKAAVLAGSGSQLQLILDAYASSGNQVETIYVLDATQHAVLVGLPTTRTDERSNLLGVDFSSRTFVQQARASNESTWSDSYISASGKAMVAVAIPVGKQTFLAEIGLDKISAFVKRMEEQNGVLTVILDRNGHSLIHPESTRSLQQENWLNNPLVKAGYINPSAMGEFYLGEETYIGTATRIAELGWVTLVAKPKRIALATLHTTTYLLLAVIGATIVFALFVSLVAANYVSKRIGEFGAFLQSVVAGDYTKDFRHFRIKEIERLADGVRDMAMAVLERESRLRLSEAKYREVVETTQDLIFRVDTEGRLIFVNSMSEAYFGLSPDACINLLAFDFTHADDRQPTIDAFKRWLKGDSNFIHIENRLVSHSGDTHRMQWHGVPDRDEQGKVIGFTCIGRDMTEIAHFNRKLAEANAQLMLLSNHRERAREEERKTIAQELHDELGQILTALRIELSALRIRYAANNPELNAGLLSVLELSDKTMYVIRGVINTLRPVSLDLGIAPALDLLVGSLKQHTGIDFVFNITPERIVLSEQRSVSLFRIVQEALTNIVRHSGASHATIGLSRQGNQLTLKVADTGRGFDLSNVDVAEKYGLSGMRERAEMLGGTISIVSAINFGTVITLTLPEYLETEE